MAAILDFRLANLTEWITIEMSYANVGACITICMIHPNNARYLLTVKLLQPAPRQLLQHARRHLAHEMCNFRQIRCALHLTSCVQGSVYIYDHDHVNIHNIITIYVYMSERA